MKKLFMLGCSAAASLLFVSGSVLAVDNYEWPHWEDPIQGSWQVEVTVRLPAEDCTTSPPVPIGPNPFPSFNTFHEGGTMTEQGSRSSPAARSTGFGIWERIGRRDYVYRNIFHSFDANGLLIATMDISADLNLAKSENTFEGISRLARTDISGNTLHFCATLRGERITF